MADDRLQYQAPFIAAKELPQVNVDTGAARYMNTLSNVFLTNAGEAHKRQLASDLELAQTEGQRVGYENGKNFAPQKSDSLFSRQYNASGITSAMEKIQVDTQSSLKDFYQQNKMDPDGLAKSITEYSRGYLSKLNPAIQPSIQQHLDKVGASLVETSKENLRKFNQDASAVKFEQYDNEMENTLEVIAPSMFAGGDTGRKAQAAVAEMRQNYISTIAQHGPPGKYQAGGYTIDGTGHGSGALTPQEVAKKLRDFDTNVITSGVLGNYVKEAEAGRGVDAYMTFVKGNVQVTALNKAGELENMRVSDFLTNDEMEKVASKMRQYSSGVDGMEDAVYKKWDRQRERTTDTFKRTALDAAYDVEKQPDGTERIVGGDPIKIQALIAQGLNNPMVKPEAVQELQTLAEKVGTGAIDNPMIAGEARIAVASGEINSYKDLPATGLSDETRIKLHSQIDARLKGQDWSSSVRYRQANDYAEAMLAPAKSAGFNIFGDTAGNNAAAADLAEWKRRMITDAWAAQSSGTMPANPDTVPKQLPGGHQEFDFVNHGRELADEIAARRNKPAAVPPEIADIDAKIKVVEQRMSAPQTGDDTKATADEYRKLMDQKAQLQARGISGAGAPSSANPPKVIKSPSPSDLQTVAPAPAVTPKATPPAAAPAPVLKLDDKTQGMIDNLKPERQSMVTTMQPVIASLVSKGIRPNQIKDAIKDYYAQFEDVAVPVGDGKSNIKNGTAKNKGMPNPEELTALLNGLQPEKVAGI